MEGPIKCVPTGLLAAAVALLIAGVSVSWLVYDGGQVGYWQACDSNGNNCASTQQQNIGMCANGNSNYAQPLSNSQCQEWLAAEAFLIVAIILLIVALIIAAVSALGKGTSNTFTALLVLTGIVFVFNLIGFAIGTSFWGNNNIRSAVLNPKVGAGVALTAVAWILELAALGVLFVSKRPGSAVG